MRQWDNHDDLLKQIHATDSPASMRSLAVSLLRLADSIDQNWSEDHVRLQFSGLSREGAIERKSFDLSRVAYLESQRMKLRARHLDPDLLGEPAWNILLELFQRFAGGAKVSTKSLQLIAGCPETTALRVIDRLEKANLIMRQPLETDKRMTMVSLTRTGVLKVGSALEELDR